MENFEFDIDFGDESFTVIEDEVVLNQDSGESDQPLETPNDPVSQDFNVLEMDEEEVIADDDTEEESNDLSTHQLFIEGWQNSGFLVLPDDYDVSDKSVTQVMEDSAKYFNEAIKQNFLENLPEDIREAARLAIEGKIRNAKEYLNYQVQADAITESISSTEEARKFLESYYKEHTALDADDIEQTLDSLELKDKLVEKATSIKSKIDDQRKKEFELKKEELLQKEAAEKAAKEKAMAERVTKVKAYIDSSNWSAEHKKYVQDEISKGMKDTVSNIQAAITDPDVTAEFVSLMSRLLTKDSTGKISISKESLKEFASSKVAKEIKTSWESKLERSNLPKPAAKSVKTSSQNELIYELIN